MASTAAFHARARGSVHGLGGLKETENATSSSSGGSFIRGVSVKEELSVCMIGLKRSHINMKYIVASELKDPICHSDECQIGSFSSEATVHS